MNDLRLSDIPDADLDLIERAIATRLRLVGEWLNDASIPHDDAVYLALDEQRDRLRALPLYIAGERQARRLAR